MTSLSLLDAGSVLGLEQVDKSGNVVDKDVKPPPEKKSRHPAKIRRNLYPKLVLSSVKIFRLLTRNSQKNLEALIISKSLQQSTGPVSTEQPTLQQVEISGHFCNLLVWPAKKLPTSFLLLKRSCLLLQPVSNEDIDLQPTSHLSPPSSIEEESELSDQNAGSAALRRTALQRDSLGVSHRL